VGCYVAAGLLNSLCRGFDRAVLVESMGLLDSKEVRAVVAGLAVSHIVCSYKVADLLAVYVSGSREWLYRLVTAWLDKQVAPMQPVQPSSKEVQGDAAATGGEEQPAQQATLDAQSRMFLLLAGPGMGKSVFSAVVGTAGPSRASPAMLDVPCDPASGCVGTTWIAALPHVWVQRASAAALCLGHPVDVHVTMRSLKHGRNMLACKSMACVGTWRD
jgi:hypothetical protein